MYRITKGLRWRQNSFQLLGKAIMTLVRKLYTIVDPGYVQLASRPGSPIRSGATLQKVFCRARASVVTVARTTVRRCASLIRESARGNYWGHAAPPSIQILSWATVSGRESGGNVRPSPGFQPQPTRSSSATWWKSSSNDRLPFCLGSLICLQSSPAGRPTKTILSSGVGSPHLGLPGGMCAPGRFAF